MDLVGGGWIHVLFMVSAEDSLHLHTWWLYNNNKISGVFKDEIEYEGQQC